MKFLTPLYSRKPSNIISTKQAVEEGEPGIVLRDAIRKQSGLLPRAPGRPRGRAQRTSCLKQEQH